VGQAFNPDGANDNLDLGIWVNHQRFTITPWFMPGTFQVHWADIIDNNHTDGKPA
jgi:hypothetical protein